MKLISKEVVRRIIDSERTREQMLEMVESAVADDSSTVYVVTQDGYLNSYGSEIYLVGVFTDKKKAEKAASAERAMITEIPLNKKFPLKKSTWGGVGNDYYLGGYFE